MAAPAPPARAAEGGSSRSFGHLRGRQDGLSGVTHTVPSTPLAPHVVRLRGLPFTAKDNDVRSFFGDCSVGTFYSIRA